MWRWINAFPFWAWLFTWSLCQGMGTGGGPWEKVGDRRVRWHSKLLPDVRLVPRPVQRLRVVPVRMSYPNHPPPPSGPHPTTLLPSEMHTYNIRMEVGVFPGVRGGGRTKGTEGIDKLSAKPEHSRGA